MRKIFISLFIVQIFCSAFLVASVSKAETEGIKFTPQVSVGEWLKKGKEITITNSSIGEYIINIYNYAIAIIGVIAAIVLMLGGLTWMTSAGSSTRVTEAKAWIGASLAGLLIAFSSFLILEQINPALVKFKPLKIQRVTTSKTATSTGVAILKCEDCVELSDYGVQLKPNQGSQVTRGFAEKLAEVERKCPNIWRVTEAYPPTVKHNNKCHKRGTCVDANLKVGFNNYKNVRKLYNCFKSVGLSRDYEVDKAAVKKGELPCGSYNNFLSSDCLPITVTNSATFAPHFSVYY